MPKISRARGATKDGVAVVDERGDGPVLLRAPRIQILDGRLGMSSTAGGDPVAWLEPTATGLNVDGELTVGLERVGQAVTHDWATSSTTGWSPVTVSASGTQSFTATASATTGRFTVTGTVAGNVNHRVAYLRDHTSWRDGEVHSVIYGPTADWDGTNAQQGHVHRVRRLSTGSWEAITIWTTIVGGSDYGYLHANAMRWDGTTLLQGTGADSFFGPFGYGDASYIDHALAVTARERTNPFFFNNNFRVLRPELITVAADDLVAITAFVNTTYNEASIAVNAVDLTNGIVTVIEPTTAATDAYAIVNAGLITPTGVDSQKRYCPFHLATRVVGGTASSVTAEAKRWRLDEQEPDWGDARVQRGAITTSGSVSSLPISAGLHGLWSGHFHDSSGGAWGPVTMRRAA